MRLALLALVALATAGCATTVAPADSEVFHWTCDGGKAFDVTYDAGYTFAFVKAAGADYRLPAMMAASGSRYSTGKVEFWEHHGEAMLNGVSGGSFENCKIADES